MSADLSPICVFYTLYSVCIPWKCNG